MMKKIKRAAKTASAVLAVILALICLPPTALTRVSAVDSADSVDSAEKTSVMPVVEKNPGGGGVIAVLGAGFGFGLDALSAPVDYVPSLSKQTVLDAVPHTAAGEKLGADNAKALSRLYITAKLPFVFDYADGDGDVKTDDASGNLYASVAAARKYEDKNGKTAGFNGTCPGAQLLYMKVMPDGSAIPSPAAAANAVMDAVLLGADAVLLGFDDASVAHDAGFIAACAAAEKAGVPVFAGAGDSGSIGTGSLYYAAYGVNRPSADLVDFGNTSALADVPGIVSVACADSGYAGLFSFTYDGETVDYTDTNTDYDATGGLTFAQAMGAGEFPFIPVGGVGTPEDFAAAGAELKGKTALVIRGELSFADKVKNAYEAGAAAVIIYNNDPETDGSVRMDITGAKIPAVFIGSKPGALMAEKGGSYTLAEEDGEPMMTPSRSLGMRSDLSPAVDITSVGGYTPASYKNGRTVYVSGSSYAAAAAAGEYTSLKRALETSGRGGEDVMALLKASAIPALGEVVDFSDDEITGEIIEETEITGENTGETENDAENSEKSETDAENTGETETDADDGYYAPPFVQGAGVVSALTAIKASAYASASMPAEVKASPDGAEVKASLSVTGTGASDMTEYSLTAALYAFETASFKDAIAADESGEVDNAFAELFGIDPDAKLPLYITGRTEEVGGALIYAGGSASPVNVNADGFSPFTVAVKSGKTEKLPLRVSIPSDAAAALSERFPNGCWLFGTVTLVPGDGSPVISVPYSFFYGDYGDAPSLGAFNFEDGASYYAKNALVTMSDSDLADSFVTLGINNVYGSIFSSKAYGELAALSPQAFWTGELYLKMYPQRDITSLKVRITDAEGKILHERDTGSYKRVTADSHGFVEPVYVNLWSCRDADNYLCRMPDGEYVCELTVENGFGGSPRTVKLPFRVDTKKPVMVKAEIVETEGLRCLRITADDDLAVQTVTAIDALGGQLPVFTDRSKLFSPESVLGVSGDDAESGDAESGDDASEDDASETDVAEVLFDVTNVGTNAVCVRIADYAFNETVERVYLPAVETVQSSVQSDPAVTDETAEQP